MDCLLRIGFSSIKHNISFNPQGKTKGEALVSAGHVQRVEELRSVDSDAYVRCSVVRQTSVTSPPYKVVLKLNSDREVTDVACTCVSQAGKKCKHVYALIHYINTDQSRTKTSIEQTWGKPSDRQIGKEMYSKAEPLAISFKPPLCEKVYTPDVLTYEEIAHIPCGLRLLENYRSGPKRATIETAKDNSIAPETNDNSCEVCAENLINFCKEHEIYSSGSVLDENDRDFYSTNIELSEKEIVELCVLTVGQAQSKEWFSARSLRISASSKAHQIKSRKIRTIESLLESFFTTSTCISSSMLYGSRNETKAIAEYKRVYNAKVVPIGLIVLQAQAWICASPDGVVVDDGCITKILEIKCPSTCANKPVFDAESEKFNVPYLYLYKTNIELKSSHQYYTQVQIEMYVTGCTECDLYVWSPMGSALVTVHRNENFLQDIVPQLENFYFNYYMKYLTKRDKENSSTMRVN